MLKSREQGDLHALRGLGEDEDGFPAVGAGAFCAISSLVIASSGSDSVKDILDSGFHTE